MKQKKVLSKVILSAIVVLTIAGVFMQTYSWGPHESGSEADQTPIMHQDPTRAPKQNEVSKSIEAAKEPEGSSSLSEPKELLKSVLNLKNHPDQRRKSLSHLIEQGVVALPQLAAVAVHKIPSFPLATDPHSAGQMQRSFEIGLRITAIEALDQLGAGGADVTRILQHARDTHKEEQLVFLAKIALDGIAEGRPGKVTRFIDKVFDDALGESN